MSKLGILFDAYLGRYSGPQYIYTMTHTGGAGQTLALPKPFNLNRPLLGVFLNYRARVVIAGANYTAVAAEAPYTILNNIRFSGTYKGQAVTPINISGATAFTWTRLFNLRGSSWFNSGTRQAEPSIPNAQAGATFGNTGTYELNIPYWVPFYPSVSEGMRARTSVPYMLRSVDWGDTLNLTITAGDNTSFGTPAGGTTVTFTAPGSATGSPTIDVYGVYSQLGALRNDDIKTALVIRNEQQITAGMSTVGSMTQIANLTKQKTTNVVAKSGVLLTGTSSFANVAASLSDTMLDQTQIIVDQNAVKQTYSNIVSKEFGGLMFGTIQPGGYFNLSFIDSQNPRTAFRADLPSVVGPGSQFILQSNILTSTANQFVNLIQEQIYADYDDPFWMDTK